MELFERIERTAERARQAELPHVDVVDRVCRTIRLQQAEEPALLDTPSMAFAGLSLGVTVLTALMFMPLLSTLLDPMAAYMNSPWSF